MSDILPTQKHGENIWKMNGDVREMFHFEEIKQTQENDDGKEKTKDMNRVNIENSSRKAKGKNTRGQRENQPL